MRKSVNIRYSYSALRRFLIPFYSLYEIGIFIFLELILVGIAYILVPEHFMKTAFFGYIGWFFNAQHTSPSILSVRRGAGINIVSLVRGLGLVLDPVSGTWVPPVPRFLRWPYNRIEINEVDGMLYLCGPRHYLKLLQEKIV